MVPWLLSAWTLFVILGLHGSLATRGPELGSRGMEAVLPVGWGPPRLGNVLASSLYPGWGLFWCVVATAWRADLTTSLSVLGIGLGTLCLLIGTARWISERRAATTSYLPTWAWVSTWLVMVGLANGAM